MRHVKQITSVVLLVMVGMALKSPEKPMNTDNCSQLDVVNKTDNSSFTEILAIGETNCSEELPITLSDGDSYTFTKCNNFVEVAVCKQIDIGCGDHAVFECNGKEYEVDMDCENCTVTITDHQ